MNQQQLKTLSAHLDSRHDLFRQINPDCPELVGVFLEGLALRLCRSTRQAASGVAVAYTLPLPREVFVHLTTGLIYELGTSLSLLVRILQPDTKMTQLYPEQSPTYEFGEAVFFYRLETGFTSLYLGLGLQLVVGSAR